MEESIIQNQIRLVAFKAMSVNFYCSTEKGLKTFFDLKLQDLLISDNPKLFAKVFLVELVSPSGFDSEFVRFNIEYHTVFECGQNINEAFLKTEFAKISAPAIGFPYVRAFISTLSMQAGLPPVILPSINFVQFSREIEARHPQQTSKTL